MSDFLPKDTEIPTSEGKYMKFKSGDNRFRIVGSAIVGNELWVNNKPIRRTLDGNFTPDELEDADINKFTGEKKKPQYFWAFPVYNYETKNVEILELLQKTIMRGIKGIQKDEDYGNDVTKYDLVVVRDDDSDPVSYAVRPKPPKPLDKGVKEYVDEMVKKIDLHELYKGGDPFNPEQDFDIPDS